MSRSIITGIDIGTYHVKVVIAEAPDTTMKDSGEKIKKTPTLRMMAEAPSSVVGRVAFRVPVHYPIPIFPKSSAWA